MNDYYGSNEFLVVDESMIIAACLCFSVLV
jgi:hypothetical protein